MLRDFLAKKLRITVASRKALLEAPSRAKTEELQPFPEHLLGTRLLAMVRLSPPVS
jgi:hypothetical protein